MSAVPLRNNKATVCVARTVSVLGATGSIGDSTMDLLRGAPERYQVEALTANSNVAALAKLAREFNARFVAIADPDLLKDLQDALRGTGTECGAGESAIIEAAARPADWVMAAVSGAAGLKPALAAVDRGATVALANKESWSVRAIFSCSARPRPGPASCQRIPSITRSFRRLVPAIARNWFASSSLRRAARSEPGTAPISNRRRWRRR